MKHTSDMCSCGIYDHDTGTRKVRISELHDFEGHPFKVEHDMELFELMRSIEEKGILVPLLVRPNPKGSGYEIIAGHRRKVASEWAGIDSVPVMVVPMNDEDAIIAMVDSNLQREHIKPSEKAFAYKMKLDAMKQQGKKLPDTLSQVGTKLNKQVNEDGKPVLRSDVILARQVGESRNQIHRFIRLTELIPELLDMVDTKKMPLVTAVDISYIDQKVQQYLYEYIKDNGMVKSYQVTALRKYLEDYESISQSKMITVLNEMITGKTQSKSVHFTEKKLRKYFSSNYTVNDMEKIMIRLLEKWKSEQEGGNNGI